MSEKRTCGECRWWVSTNGNYAPCLHRQGSATLPYQHKNRDATNCPAFERRGKP